MFKASGVLFLGLCRGRSNGDLRCYGEGEHFALLQLHTVLCRCNRRGKRKEKKGEVGSVSGNKQENLPVALVGLV